VMIPVVLLIALCTLVACVAIVNPTPQGVQPCKPPSTTPGSPAMPRSSAMPGSPAILPGRDLAPIPWQSSTDPAMSAWLHSLLARCVRPRRESGT
jgi:hypothetical protein